MISTYNVIHQATVELWVESESKESAVKEARNEIAALPYGRPYIHNFKIMNIIKGGKVDKNGK